MLGVVFLCLILTGVWAAYGVFTKKFTDYDEVTLETSKIGLQLPMRADVKIRGVQVGEVIDIDADADGARVTLGLYPDERGQIPANVTGSIVPKTLFGEKYVSLVVPEQPSPDSIAVGRHDHPHRGLHRGRAGALRPLPAAARGAAGRDQHDPQRHRHRPRGPRRAARREPRGRRRLPAAPQPRAAGAGRGPAADRPGLRHLRRRAAGGRHHPAQHHHHHQTLEGREDKLHALFKDIGRFSATTERFLDTNGDNLIRLGELGRTQLRVLARYAPEYPCLLGGIVKAGDLQAEAFRGFTLHIVLETLPNQPRGYGPQDAPVYGDTRGPHCGSLPNPPYDQDNPVTHQPDFVDGIDEPTGKGTSRSATGWAGGDGYTGGRQEAGLLKGLLGPPSAPPPPTSPTSGCCWWDPWRGAPP